MRKPITKAFNNKTLAKSIKYRGKVLHEISLMEMLINVFLGEHFCGINNPIGNRDMQILILGDDRMTLSAKAQVFHYIANNHYKEGFELYKSMRIHPEAPKKKYALNHDLDYVIQERNVFAHRILEGDVNAIVKSKSLDAGVIRFVKLKNGVDGVDYTEKKFKELIDTIQNIYVFIGLMSKDIRDIHSHSV